VQFKRYKQTRVAWYHSF